MARLARLPEHHAPRWLGCALKADASEHLKKRINARVAPLRPEHFPPTALFDQGELDHKVGLVCWKPSCSPIGNVSNEQIKAIGELVEMAVSQAMARQWAGGDRWSLSS